MSDRMMPARRAAAALVLLAAVAAVPARRAAGDTLTKTDGTVYTGRILKETPGRITMEVHRYGAKYTVSVSRIQVRSIVRGDVPPAPAASTRPAATTVPSGPGYYPIPLIGRLGGEALPDAFAKALADARASKADVIVLYVNSGGGTAAATDRLVGMLAAAADLRVVAYVRQAEGPAAAIALRCKQIYVAGAGVIGAGTGGDLSRADLRAMLVAAAEAGGHPTLLAQGMTDPDLELAVATQDDRPVVTEGTAGRPLKAAGGLLTLTGTEAVECGLARGASETLEALHAPMGLKAWHKVSGAGWAMMVQAAREQRLARTRDRREQSREEAEERRRAYLERIAPRLAEIDKELDAVRRKGKAAEAEKADLQARYDKEIKKVHNDYERRMRQLRRRDHDDGHDYHRQRRRAREDRDRRLEGLKKRFGPQAARIQSAIRGLYGQMTKLQKKRERLTSGG